MIYMYLHSNNTHIMNTETEVKDYGEVMNYALLTVFGGEMTYNELKKYAEDLYEYTDLQVHTTVITDMNNTKYHITTVFFNGEVVLNTQYREHHSCDMYYHLNGLEEDLANMRRENEDEELRGDANSHC